MIRSLKNCDKILLVLLIAFSVFGLYMITSASSVSSFLRYNFGPYHFFVRQLVFVSFSIIFGLFILSFPTKNYKYFSFLYVAFVIVMLVGLFVYGRITNNAQSWYDFGPVSIQPSEFAKTALIIFMATYYDLLARKKSKNINFYVIPMIICVVFVGLVTLQPDLGSAIIILAIGGGIFISIPFVRRNYKKFLKFLAISLIVIGPFAFLLFKEANFLDERHMSRFTFKNPCSRYREQTGYQVCNGFIAIHNGGLFGVGLGNSTQKYLYLPESHTDFIFPIIVEETGLIVGVTIILLYILMLWRIIKIAKESYNLKNSILCYGAFIYIASHIIVNLGGVLALIPLTGVPLPFLSYGGSFTINVILIVFVILRVSAENYRDNNKQELKKIVN